MRAYVHMTFFIVNFDIYLDLFFPAFQLERVGIDIANKRHSVM